MTPLHATMDIRACRALWAAVLINVLRDLCGVAATKGPDTQKVRAEAREAAEAWVGRFPRKDFRLVCEGAGLEPDAVHDRLRPLIDLSPGERRRKMGKLLAFIHTNPGNGDGSRTDGFAGPTRRRERVAEMFAEGVAPSEMTDRFAATGIPVPVTTIWNDLKYLRAKGKIGAAHGSAPFKGRAAHV